VNTRYKGERVRCLVHRAVALSFIPNPLNLPTINHLNADKTDNRVENLEWATYQRQADHVKELGLKETVYGEDTSNWKYPEKLIRQICQLIENGYRNCDIIKKFDIDRKLPSDIRNRKSWTHISKDYDLQIKRRGRLSEETVHWICKNLEDGFKVKEILKKSTNSNITTSVIRHIKQHNSYIDISNDYNF